MANNREIKVIEIVTLSDADRVAEDFLNNLPTIDIEMPVEQKLNDLKTLDITWNL